MDISMSFDPVSSGFSFVSGLANSIGGAHQAVKNRRHQNAMLEKQQTWSEQMAEKQNQWNIDQWNRENEYNSPVNQMSRMAAAGINPYNAASSGQIGSGTASSLRSATPNTVTAPAYSEAYSNPVGNFISGLSSSLDNALKVISVDREKKLTPSVVKESEGRANSADAEGVKAQNDLVNEPSRVAANFNLYQSQMHEFAFNSQKYALLGQGVSEIVANELAQMRSNTQIMQLQAEGMGYDNKQKYAIAKFAEATEKAKLDQLVQQGELTKAQAENMRKQNTWFGKITMAQLANYAAQTAAAYGSADASHAAADASHAAAGLNRAETTTENTLRRARVGEANEQYRNLKLQNDNYAPSFEDWLYHSDQDTWVQLGYGKYAARLIGEALNGDTSDTPNKTKTSKPRKPRKPRSPRPGRH